MSKLGNKLDQGLFSWDLTKKIGEVWSTKKKVTGADVDPP